MSFERVRQLAQGSRESTALVFRGEPFRDLVAARVEVFTKTEPKELQKQIVAAATLAPALSDALSALLTRYVELASSGDCGFWDCETEPQVIAAREVLQQCGVAKEDRT